MEGSGDFTYEKVFMKESDIYTHLGIEVDHEGKIFSKDITFSKLWMNEKTVRYQGGWIGSLPEGEGVLFYSEKLFFRGNFSKGLREGDGDVFYGGELLYSGPWKNDILQKYHPRTIFKNLEEFEPGIVKIN